MDSWDWEALYLLVDGVPVWNMYSQWGYHNINLGGNPGWGD